MIVPEKGYVTPGMVIACGDSHTGTLGAFGTFALGVGSTAQAGAMLAQVLVLQRPKSMKIEVTGKLADDVTAKDLDPHDHQDDRFQGRHRLRARVHGLGDQQALDGRPHDRLQHGDRSGRDGRRDRAG